MVDRSPVFFSTPRVFARWRAQGSVGSTTTGWWQSAERATGSPEGGMLRPIDRLLRYSRHTAACAVEGSLSLASAQSDSETGSTALQSTQAQRWAQALILAMLYSFPVLVCARNATVADPDVWWQMRTGQWILNHGGFPHTDPFSIGGAGKAWAAYSWLFDLIVFKLYQWLGLTGIVTYTAGMVVATTVALHRMVRRLYPDFTTGVLLTVVACVCMEHMWTPRSWLFTVLCFTIEIDILMHARRSGKKLEVWLLPLLFMFWANLHIEFLYGLAVLAILTAEAVLARWWNIGESRLKAGAMCAVLLASSAATLVNPYGWGLYATAYGLGSQQGVLGTVSEMMAMPFRDIGDYGVLLFSIAAAVVLARTRRRRVFEVALLAFALLISFRARRDVFVVAIAACAIVAEGLNDGEKTGSACGRFAVPVALVATVAAAPLLFAFLKVDNVNLESKLADEMPVHAAEFVKSKNLKGPLFNDYNWGGYLMWNQGLPVSIDGRAALDGDALIARSIATWNGLPGWDRNPELRKAQLVIGPVDAPLNQLLRFNSHFELAYQDNVAAVFVARSSSGKSIAGDPSAVTDSARAHLSSPRPVVH